MVFPWRMSPTSTFPTLVPITTLPTPQFPSPSRNRFPLVSLRTPTLRVRLEHRSEAKKEEARLPNMAEILESATAQKVDLRLQTLGPFFRITARRVGDGEELGKAEGLIRVWLSGKILHLDSIRLRRESLGMEKSIFGIGLFIGAVAIRYGYDCGCRKAELLAINDSDLYHSKLVRFYKRIGFEVVEEVRGGKVGDIGHMLVWGGIGTRMEADLHFLLSKWCSRVRSFSLVDKFRKAAREVLFDIQTNLAKIAMFKQQLQIQQVQSIR